MASAIQSMVGPAARDAVAEIRREVADLRGALPGRGGVQRPHSPSSSREHRRQGSPGASTSSRHYRELSLADGISSPGSGGGGTGRPAPLASHHRRGSSGSLRPRRDSASTVVHPQVRTVAFPAFATL